MTQSEIQHFFQQRYNRDAWVRFLGQAFSNASLLSSPELLTGINTDVAAQVYKLGFITLNEDGVERQIAIYEVTLAKGIVLERNRVGLRNLLRKYWKNIDAAFISFYNPESSNWRFTYVSELTGFDAEGEFISIKTEPKRYTYILGEGETCRTAAERFALLVTKGKKAGLDDIKDAFSVEKLSKAFFDEYKSQYEDFVEFLTGKRIIKIDGDWQEKQIRQPSPQLAFIFHGSEKAARDFCKKMLGRIVFLYFIQKKGWLGVPVKSQWGEGNKNFVSDLFDKCRHKDIFYSEILTKLFFEALNRERDEDIIELINGITYRIPYLNGGLFEEENTEYRRLIFPAQLFQNLFTFFNQYNFTIYEDDPNDHTIAVDPEMLGHIFENLLEDNKDKGAYYTPKEIVHYMCQESLIEYLTTWFEKRGYRITGYIAFDNPDQFQVFSVNEGREGQMLLEYPIKTSTKAISRFLIEKLLKKNLEENDKHELLQYYDEFQEALNSVKICDPAIGSGAFPMGLLHEIYNAKQTIHLFKFNSLTGFHAAKEKLNIIQNSIYGVDIEKGAVDIARLRFWLSLVVDEQIPKPLPNLDYKIVVGDSLLSKLGNQVVNINWNTKATSHGLYGQELAQQRKLLLKRIIKEQKEFFNPDCDKHSKSALIRDIKIDLLINQFESMIKLVNQETQPIVTNFKDKSKYVQACEHYQETIGWKKQIKALINIKSDPNRQLHFFDWKLDFPEIMNEQVVDVKGFDIVIGNPPYRLISKDEFLSTYKSYILQEGKIDLYRLFIEKGTKILKENGIFNFIIPNTLLTIPSCKLIRKFFLEHHSIKNILNFADGVFENVSVNSIIFSSVNRLSNNNMILINQNAQLSDFEENNFHPIFQRDFYKNSKFEYNIFINNDEDKIIQKIKSISTNISNLKIEVTLGAQAYHNTIHTQEQIKNRFLHSPIQKSKNYVLELGGRKIMPFFVRLDGEYVDFSQDFYTKPANKFFFHPKVILREITGKKLIAAYSEDKFIVNKSCYVFIHHDIKILKVLLAILNSKLIGYLINKTGDKSNQKIFPRITMNTIQNIPVCFPKDISKIVEIVDIVISKKKLALDTAYIEKELDTLIYKVYELDYSEVKIIDKDFLMTESDYVKVKV